MGPVAVSPFELHPLKLANLLYTLNEFSNGRANIVIGGGGGTMIAMNLKAGRYVMHPRMVRGVRECVEFLHGVSADTPLNFDGELFRVSNYQPRWADDARPRVYVGATKPQMLRMAASCADGVMFSDLTEGRLDETMKILDDALQSAGRAEFHTNNLFCWHVKPDIAAAKAEARRKLWVRGMLEHWYISPVLDDDECAQVATHMPAFIKAYSEDSAVIENVPDQLVDKLIDELTFTGDHDDIDRLIGRFWHFKNAGITEMGLRLYDDPATSMRKLADVIGPELH